MILGEVRKLHKKVVLPYVNIRLGKEIFQMLFKKVLLPYNLFGTLIGLLRNMIKVGHPFKSFTYRLFACLTSQQTNEYVKRFVKSEIVVERVDTRYFCYYLFCWYLILDVCV